jgi:hypothetical protein
MRRRADRWRRGWWPNEMAALCEKVNDNELEQQVKYMKPINNVLSSIALTWRRRWWWWWSLRWWMSIITTFHLVLVESCLKCIRIILLEERMHCVC